MSKIKDFFGKVKTQLQKRPAFFAIAGILLLAILALLARQFFEKPAVLEVREYNVEKTVGYNVSKLYAQSVYTDDDGKVTLGTPDSLRINFNSDVSFDTEEERKALEDIKINPQVNGSWKWSNARTLVFTPEKEWPSGITYNVKLPKNLIGQNTEENLLKLKKYDFTFDSPAFTQRVNSFTLYKDPLNPKIFNALAQLSFSHSVEPAEFEKHIALTLNKNKLNYEITYDEVKRNASVKSVPVTITDAPQLVNLNISRFNNAGAIDKTLDIPSSSMFFKLSSVSTQIVRDEEDTPHQAVILSFTDSLKQADLNAKVKAYILPLKNPRLKDRPQNQNSGSGEICETRDCDCDEYDDECYCNSEPVCYVPTFSRYDQWAPVDITNDVLKTLKPLKLDPVPAVETYSQLFSYKYSLDPAKTEYIYFVVESGLQSSAGFDIKKNISYVIKVPPYPKELKTVGDGSLLSLAGSKKVSYASRGLDAIRVEVARILPGNLNHFISQTGGSFAQPYFYNSYNFNKDNISENFTKTINLTYDAQKVNYSSVDLNEYFTPGKTGFFLLESYGWNPKGSYGTTPRSTRFILITNMGMLTKTDIDGNVNVYVMGIDTGSPLSGVKVQLIGKNGLPLFTKYTDSNGMAKFSAITGFSREKEPVAFVAQQGTDTSFIPVNRYDRNLDFSRFNTEGVYYSSYRHKGLTSFLFSDRGIYRPGDDINIGVISKNPTWTSVAGIPVKFVMQSPKGKTVYEKKISLTSDGMSAFTIPTSPVSETGTYTAYLYNVTREHYNDLLGSVTVRVEEFQEDKLKIKTSILGSDKKGWQPMEGLSAKVNLENLYGIPAQDNRVKIDMRLTPLTFRFGAYKEYSFDDPLKNKSSSATQAATDTLADKNTNDDGIVTADIDLSKYSGGSYNLSIEAEGFEQESGSSVYATDSVWVSPNRYLVGKKSANNLNYLKRGAVAAVDFVAVNPNLEKIDLTKMKARVLEMQYVSTLVKQYNNTYKYQSSLKETQKFEEAFEIKKAGSSFTLPTANGGRYALEIYDEFNVRVSRAEFFVAGAANTSYSLDKDAELMLNLEKDEVAPGENLTLSITAPYTGAGLITIEREKVYAQKWFKAGTLSSQQTIRVPDDFEGNGYVNVSFIRGADSKDIYTTPLSYAVAPFYVKRDRRTTKIDLDIPSTVLPGSDLEIRYKTSRPTKIILYGASEGILQVAKYTLPNPLNHFLKKMALEVRTGQTLDMILPDFKMVEQFAAAGGDMDDEMMKEMLAANLNPFARKRDKPVVFWSGVIDAGTAYKTFKYPVPQYFNGAIRVMAVAANIEAAGAASSSLVARAPIIMMAGHPFAAAPGDEFDVNLRVTNNKADSKDGKIKVSLKTNKLLQVIGQSSFDMEIPYGTEKTVSFKAKALEELGSADMTFTAEHKNPAETITANASLSVRPATVYTTTLKTGRAVKSPAEITGFYRNMYPHMSEISAFASNSPLILAGGLEKYFRKYPHGCSEQITSQVFPFLGLAPESGKGVLKRADVEASFNSAVSKLRRRQFSDGGFSMWDGGSSETKDITIYIAHFLTDAKDYGYAVPADMLSNVLSKLDQYAAKYPTSNYEAEQAAKAAYILARNGKVITNYLVRTEEYLNKNQKDWQNSMTGAYMASAYKLLKDSAKAQSVINAFKPEGKKYLFYSDYDSSSIRNANYMYLMGRHFPDRVASGASIIEGLVENIVNNNYNTMSSAATIMALTAYSSAVQSKDGAIKMFDLTDAKNKKELSRGNTFSMPEFDINFATQNLELQSPDMGPLGVFFIISTQGFDKTAPDVSKAKGLEITREYKNAEGKTVTSAKVGEDLTVSIKIRSTAKDYVTNTAIIDLLPGAFEAVSASVSGNTEFYDIREDRVLIYLTASKNIQEITYKVKVIASGEFQAPMTFAQSLYDTDTSGYSKAGKITVAPAR